ncbi:MAG: type II toxin-antitoxin system VapC family toxin [Anaerolineae bacterium]
MNYLLDTHTFLWFIDDDVLLSGVAKALMEDANHQLYLSIASIWEMAIKISLGKLSLPSPYDDFIAEQLEQNHISLYPILLSHANLVTKMPFHHRDPFDRLIIAQSLTDQIPIIGRDDIYDQYGVQRHW